MCLYRSCVYSAPGGQKKVLDFMELELLGGFELPGGWGTRAVIVMSLSTEAPLQHQLYFCYGLKDQARKTMYISGLDIQRRIITQNFH